MQHHGHCAAIRRLNKRGLRCSRMPLMSAQLFSIRTATGVLCAPAYPPATNAAGTSGKHRTVGICAYPHMQHSSLLRAWQYHGKLTAAAALSERHKLPRKLIADGTSPERMERFPAVILHAPIEGIAERPIAVLQVLISVPVSKLVGGHIACHLTGLGYC